MDNFELVLTIILGFTSSTIGGMIIRTLYISVFNKMASGINVLEEKQKITATSAELLRQSQSTFETLLVAKIDKLVEQAGQQNDKIVEYRELIDYHTARDQRIVQLISEILESFKKEGE